MQTSITHLLEEERNERQIRNYEQIAMLQKAQQGADNDNFEDKGSPSFTMLAAIILGIYGAFEVFVAASHYIFAWMGL